MAGLGVFLCFLCEDSSCANLAYDASLGASGGAMLYKIAQNDIRVTQIAGSCSIGASFQVWLAFRFR